MSGKNSVAAVVLDSFDSATFTGLAYQALNGIGLDNSCFWIFVINNSNSDILVSYDGINAHDWVKAGARLDVKVQDQHQPNNNVSLWKKGTRIWGLANAGVGNVYVGGYYQQ